MTIINLPLTEVSVVRFTSCGNSVLMSAQRQRRVDHVIIIMIIIIIIIIINQT